MASSIQIEQPESDVEAILWQGSFAARSMAGAWIGAIILSGALFIAVSWIETLRENRMVWWTLVALLGLIWVGLIGLVVYRKLGQHYEITNFQLKHRSGILVRQMNRIEMIDVDDVMYRQGPLQALLNVGSIELLSSDTSHPKLLMPGIRDVSKVANLIDDARRAERRKRGLHVEAI